MDIFLTTSFSDCQVINEADGTQYPSGDFYDSKSCYAEEH